MKNLTRALLVVSILAVFALVGSSASAYFYQPQSYPNYSYNPYQYGYQDPASRLTQANLHFVSNFVYVPTPMFYNFYSPYSYYGGYGYNYGWGW